MDNSGQFQQTTASEPDVISVSQLNRAIKQTLESEYPMVWVKGEVSNFTAHRSGHWYFSLKDDSSQVMAVMFKGHNARLKFKPDTGTEVLVRARLAVYEPRGNYQIVCELMEPVGAGALQKQFEQLKAKLAAEGLFAANRKQSLPAFPKKVAVVTSPTGAAIRDILNVLKRRNNGIEVHVFPCRVQGDSAAKEITKQVRLACEIGDYDVMIVGRGGGSMEDLWCFNDEALARVISESAIPVVSAVGHEIDFTICDFVSDVRAPTPSAAAEIITGDTGDLGLKLNELKKRMWRAWNLGINNQKQKLSQLRRLLGDPSKGLERYAQKLDDLSWRLESLMRAGLELRSRNLKEARLRLVSPEVNIRRQKDKLENTKQLLDKSMNQYLKNKEKDLISVLDIYQPVNKIVEAKRTELEKKMLQLHGLSPLNILERGYSITKKEGSPLVSTDGLKSGDSLEIKLHTGEIQARVEELR